MHSYDVLVIGGGPAGLAAAISAKKENARVLLIEREERLGGILKQCIHDGFGLLHFGEKLSGPEYVERFEDEFHELEIAYEVQTFVTGIQKKDDGFLLTAVNKNGVHKYRTATIILATGCRERTAKQVFIHGTRPAGVFTAGTAQHFVNLLGEMPTKKCVILGSGDIGLIMARRLTLEGAKVLGVYEVKPEPSGLTRNLVQCLDDYGIPLYLSHTVTRVFGEERLSAVEISQVDDKMQPILGTEEIVECDALILSVGLIPENEIAENLGVAIDAHTKGPVCDNRFMTGVEGVFSCGNALHVNDLVDYVSESGELAGKAAAEYRKTWQPGDKKVQLITDDSVQYIVPQKLCLDDSLEKVVFYFRSRETLPVGTLRMEVDGKTVYEKKYSNLKPPEMEHLELDLSKIQLTEGSRVKVSIQKGGAAL
ncbi:MAG: FAD-dependent oxidoreductase [Lachnospiraceae bacterium]|nr:FAD-dependent oxidoreductase [Lachnospiraceae bacterium]